MADVFISYAREDREPVEKLAGLLEKAGLSCWWDRQLAAGAKYRERTEIELNAAKAVLVVWTKHSASSHWVADEAAAAQEAGKLAPISLDGVPPPLGFRQFQVIDFTGWKGGEDGPVPELVSTLARFAPQAEGKITARAPSSPSRTKRRILLPLLVAALVLVAVAGVFLFLRPPTSTGPSQRIAFFGFTATDDNPLSAKIASDSTEQTFAEFTRFHLDGAAKADSLAPYTTDRLTRAIALGATYALSGEIHVEGEEAQFAIRLEDTLTRTTMWQIAETSPTARQFYSPAKQAAFRALASTDCVQSQRAQLSRESSKALQAIAGYCATLFSPAGATDLERGVRAFRTLAELEPGSVFFKTAFASQIIFTAGYQPPDLRAASFLEGEDRLKEALQIAPGNSFSIAISEMLATSRGGSPYEAEQLLATGRPTGLAWGDGFLSTRSGLNMLAVGRTERGIALLTAAEAAQPSFTQVAAIHAYGLASQGETKAADAELLFEQIFASEPGHTLVWPTWAAAAVLDGVGNPEAVLAAAPEKVPRAALACWRSVLAAKRAGTPGPAPEALVDCGPVTPILVALGRVGEAFDYGSATARGWDRRMLFSSSTRAMRAHPRFRSLVEELKLWDYWIRTGSHPDVCDLTEERDFAVCKDLRAVQPK